MAKAIFHRDFHYTSRLRNAGWSAKAGPDPQHFPQEFIDAAVSAGCATVPPPRRSTHKTPDDPAQP
ncbi:hypothetical protein KvSKV_10305 [Ketogulonicigenium vulgare]|uniref:Uncharacterized protein n=1 Tax=Ketogulonicigenium vulgare (strain WSH-001) TaxID=759362 RepID=F9Y9Z8_KETVW|nr:hypothetical protein KVU_1570 [Ketogulonicigenium vulgare WSH-001]ALJ82366.1 hypothetical protein KVH_10365 [Ketogulonicigenium vulgare]ANW35114.1 hypothetical protein KvSKV_10305 [Ketogulonicigenium vulgare]